MTRASPPVPELTAVALFVACAVVGGVLGARTEAPGALLLGALFGETLGMVVGMLAASFLITGRFIDEPIRPVAEPEQPRRWFRIIELEELPPERREHITRLGRIVGIFLVLACAPLLVGHFAGVFELERMSTPRTLMAAFLIAVGCFIMVRPQGLRKRKK